MKKHMILKLLAVTSLLLIVYALLITAIYHAMTKEANLAHHQTVVRNDAANIAEHYGKTRPFDQADGNREYLYALEDVTHGKLGLIDRDGAFHCLDASGNLCEKALGDLKPRVAQAVERALGGAEDVFRLEEDGKLYIYAAVPMEAAGGALMLKTDSTMIGDAEVTSIQTMLVSGVLGLLVAGGLAIFMMNLLTRPLRRLQTVARLLSGGDYAARSELARGDELGDLARTLDGMAEGMQKAEVQREVLRKEQEAFLSEVSHELKTPVTVICASIEAAKDGVVDTDEKKASYLAQIEREAGGLKALVLDLLEWSRLKSASFSFDKKAMSLTELMSDVAMSATRLAGGQGVGFYSQEPDRDYRVTGDYGRLRQMLMNVIDNAVKYSAPGQAVEMKMEPAAPIVTIRDHGRGMRAEDIPHIFERYNRLGRTGDAGSTGLGLSIVKQVALRHGVEVAVQSSPGEGTAFLFDFTGALEG